MSAGIEGVISPQSIRRPMERRSLLNHEMERDARDKPVRLTGNVARQARVLLSVSAEKRILDTFHDHLCIELSKGLDI